jgi:outer membrane protein assembly factor BamB
MPLAEAMVAISLPAHGSHVRVTQDGRGESSMGDAAMASNFVFLIRSTVLLAVLMCPIAAIAADAVEGYWLGSTGTERERVEVGLEFRRGEDGRLVLHLTQPIMGMYGIDVGEAKRAGDKVTNDALALDLRIDGDTLTGSFPGTRAKSELRRVRRLPQQAPLPKLPTGPAPLWQTRLGGTVYASPVVADGVAYVGTTGGVFNAVNVDDGSYAWTFAAGAAIHGAAAVDAEAVYFACDDGFLYKLARSDGHRLWRYDLGDRSAPRVLPHPAVFEWDWQGPQPVIAEGVVFVGAGDGGFHAVDAASGERKWRHAAQAKIRNGAAIDGTRIVYGSADHHVYSLDRASGKEIWRYDSKAEIDGAPLAHDGHIYIGNRGSGLYALAADSGKEIWRLYFWGSWVESTPVVADGVLYVGASDLGHVSAIAPDDGHVLWRGKVHGWSFGTPLLVGDRVYAGAAGGTPYSIRHEAGFVTLDRSSGRALTRWPFADTGAYQWGIAGSPALSGDRILVATIAGSLYAFPLR